MKTVIETMKCARAHFIGHAVMCPLLLLHRRNGNVSTSVRGREKCVMRNGQVPRHRQNRVNGKVA